MRAEVPGGRVQYIGDHEARAGRARVALVALHRHRQRAAGGARAAAARRPYRIQRSPPPPHAQLDGPQLAALTTTSHSQIICETISSILTLYQLKCFRTRIAGALSSNLLAIKSSASKTPFSKDIYIIFHFSSQLFLKFILFIAIKIHINSYQAKSNKVCTLIVPTK